MSVPSDTFSSNTRAFSITASVDASFTVTVTVTAFCTVTVAPAVRIDGVDPPPVILMVTLPVAMFT